MNIMHLYKLTKINQHILITYRAPVRTSTNLSNSALIF